MIMWTGSERDADMSCLDAFFRDDFELDIGVI